VPQNLFLNDGAGAVRRRQVADVARVGIGLAVRKGVSRPQISSPEADTARGRGERTEG
jgi:hypothetical protein